MSLSTSLVAAWELNESSGNAVDSVGSQTGTDNGTVTSGTGLIYANARQFNGTSQFFRIPDSAVVSTGHVDFTLEVWFNTSTLKNESIVAKDTNTGREYTLDLNYGGGSQTKLRWYLQGGGSPKQVDWSTLLNTNTWYQAVAYYDSVANQLGLTVNAATAQTSSYNGGTDTATDLTIGARLYPANEDYFAGRIGPVRLWKRVLTSAERTELYNSGAGRTLAYITGGSPVGTVLLGDWW